MSSTQVSEDCKAFMKSINKIKTTKNVRAKKLSAYNLFCVDMRKNLEGSPTEIMTQLGSMWKSTTETKKKTFKTKVEKMNVLALEESKKHIVEDDEQTIELKALVVELFKNFKKDLVKKKKLQDKEELVTVVSTEETVLLPVVVEA